MNITTVVAALVPPFLAGVLEWKNPINENYINSSVEREMRTLREALARFPPPSDVESTNQTDKLFEEVVAHYARGALTAAELAGLAPTLVAVALNGVAVVSEVRHPVVPIVLYFVTFIVVTIFILSMLVGRTLNEVAVVKPSMLGRSFFLTYSQLVSLVIYLVNGILFSVASIVVLSAGCTQTSEAHAVSQTQGITDKDSQLIIPQAVCSRMPWYTSAGKSYH